jgi:death on curing protein
METLSAEDILRIHEILAADFARDGDPMAPSGIRSLPLLESAVYRQHVGLGSTLKYPEPVSNAATLAFGICCDHPFYNGNKRTALVAMLVHLDRNRLCLYDTSKSELYQFMLAIADHSIGTRLDPRRPDKHPQPLPVDGQVAAAQEWLQKRVEKVRRGERPVTYRQLRQILMRFGYELENPHSNRVDVVKVEHLPASLLRKPRTVRRRIGFIGYRDEGTEVSMKDLKQARRICKLTEDDGVDADAFYNHEAVVDAFVNRYRTVLRRLAKT